jgi:hypothetical protein
VVVVEGKLPLSTRVPMHRLLVANTLQGLEEEQSLDRGKIARPVAHQVPHPGEYYVISILHFD